MVCVGTITPRKGHLVLVEALAGLLALEWELVCAGSLERDPATAEALRSAIQAMVWRAACASRASSKRPS